MSTADHPQIMRRSLLYHSQLAAGADVVERHGALQVARYQHDDEQQVRHLGLIDLSTNSRIGIKGSGAVDWLTQQRIPVPHAPNRALPTTEGSLVARLSYEEHLFLAAFDGSSKVVERVQNGSADATEYVAENTYTVPRQDSHAWLFLSGEQAVNMMSFVCGVNLKPDAFANGQIAQTSIARLNAIVIRQDVSLVPGFHLLCDTPSVEYWWDALLDAAHPLDGRAVGIDGLIHLAQQ